MKKAILMLILFICMLGTSLACVTPTPGMEITENTVFCAGTYNVSEEAIYVTGDNLDLSCNGTILTGWNAPEEQGLNMFEINGVTNVSFHDCTIQTVRNAINLGNSNDIDIYNIAAEDVDVDIVSGTNNNGVTIHDITVTSSVNGNIYIAGSNFNIYNIEGVNFIYMGYWDEFEGYAVVSNFNISNANVYAILIHGTEFNIQDSTAYWFKIWSNEVDIQGSEVYGNNFYLIQDGTDYNTENIDWCVGEVGNVRDQYEGTHPEEGSCEPLPIPEPEVQPVLEEEDNTNNAFFIQQNLAKQAEAVKKPTLIDAIWQVISNFRKMLGLN